MDDVEGEEGVQMNLYEKMLCIEAEIGVVAKNLEIQASANSRYKAVSERDVLDAVKPLMEKYKVFAYPIARELDDKGQLTSSGKYGERTSLYFHYKNVMRFVNAEEPSEFIDIPSYSTGIDTGDKADGKAMTYADKYAFMKAFKISTGDDPDQEASQEYKQTIGKYEWEQLNRMYTKDEIKAMYKELNITKGTDMPMEFYEQKKAEWTEKANKVMPDKEFF